MCLIIDSNVVRETFLHGHQDFAPIYQSIMSGMARMSYGGKLTREYLQSHAIAKKLVQLDRAGRAKKENDALVDAKTVEVQKSGLCVSDDAHIIGLALVSGSRLLCSRDNALHQDFTNPALVFKPRGSVYQNPDHAHLIRRHCG